MFENFAAKPQTSAKDGWRVRVRGRQKSKSNPQERVKLQTTPFLYVHGWQICYLIPPDLNRGALKLEKSLDRSRGSHVQPGSPEERHLKTAGCGCRKVVFWKESRSVGYPVFFVVYKETLAHLASKGQKERLPPVWRCPRRWEENRPLISTEPHISICQKGVIAASFLPARRASSTTSICSKEAGAEAARYKAASSGLLLDFDTWLVKFGTGLRS